MNDKFLALASIGFRFLSATLHFVIIARALGPEVFGTYSSVAAIAAMAALLSDFGLPLATSRATSRSPDRPKKFLASAIALRFSISIPVSLLFAVALKILLPENVAGFWDMFLISMAFQVASVIELLAIMLRASGQFGRDVGLAATNTGFYLAMTGVSVTLIAAWDQPACLVLGAMTLLARLVVMSGTVLLYLGVGNVVKGATSWALMTTVAARARRMYMDGILNNILENVDAVTAAFTLSPLEMASYQSAARISRMTSPLSSALSNVHLPRMFRATKSGTVEAIQDEIRGLALNFQILVVLGGLALIVFPAPIVRLLFGDEFLTAATTLQILGLVFVNRTLAAFNGIVLVAYNAIRFRVVTQIMTLSVFFLTFLVVDAVSGISSTSVAGALYLSSAVQLGLYTFGAIQVSVQLGRISILNLGLSGLSIFLWAISR